MKNFIRTKFRVSAAYKKLFLDERGQLRPEGDLILRDLLGFCRLFEDQGPDAGALAMREGRCQVARRILKKINFDERDLLKLEGERHGDE